MVHYRISDRPGFDVIGRETWISGQDNSLFGRFWEQCQAEGLLDQFRLINQQQPGPVTGGVILGISRVDKNPAERAFYYLIAIEKPEGSTAADLVMVHVPAGRWAIFECRGQPPDSIMQAEMFAFMEWLPASNYVHAHAPEMEVYLPAVNEQSKEPLIEFWLPIMLKA